MRKSAVLVLCHTEIRYVGELATRNENVNFYIHVDKKAELDDVQGSIPEKCIGHNVFFISKRIGVNWAGFSMIEATLNLVEAALKNEDNYYFHLFSGACVFLKSFSAIEEEMESCEKNTLFINIDSSRFHRYRLRFNVSYADTIYQRNFFSRVMTKFLQILDRFYPSKMFEKYAPFGSQWFSGNREGINLLFSLIEKEDLDFFRKKLCPDEHFFQYLIHFKGRMLTIESNRRYIVFESRNHPKILQLEDFEKIDRKFWIARKVSSETAIKLI